jgi:hypothetical protein
MYVGFTCEVLIAKLVKTVKRIPRVRKTYTQETVRFAPFGIYSEELDMRMS